MRFHKTGGILVFIGAFTAMMVLSFKNADKPTPYELPELRFFPKMPVTDNPPTLEGAELGRFLFYDPILSADKTFSCASCHRQEVAFSDAPNRFSKGIDGDLMKRNTMPLFNLAWYPALFWDGKAASIEEQVFHPLRAHNEMNLDWSTAVQRIRQSDFYLPKFQATFGNAEIDSILIAKAIAQFERTLISNNSKYDQVLRGEAYFTPAELEGFDLINDQTKGDCLHCHTTDADALGTTTKFSNNGLEAAFKPDDYKDKGKAEVTGQTKDAGQFRIPSLRNVVVTAPYMHDGRFETLVQVLDFYSEGINNSYNIDSKMGMAHQGGVRLTENEKEKVIAFLKTLTDSTFLINPEFGNPFMTKN
ncbi:MAG: cytochrome c peroxidase [Bacteroidia bacterium]